MVAACEREMMPAFTKPMVMTEVAPELCMAAVPMVPIPTPSILLRDAFSNSFFSFLELADSRLELIIWQAMRKIPIPARRVNMAEITVDVSIRLSFDFGCANLVKLYDIQNIIIFAFRDIIFVFLR